MARRMTLAGSAGEKGKAARTHEVTEARLAVLRVKRRAAQEIGVLVFALQGHGPRSRGVGPVRPRPGWRWA